MPLPPHRSKLLVALATLLGCTCTPPVRPRPADAEPRAAEPPTAGRAPRRPGETDPCRAGGAPGADTPSRPGSPKGPAVARSGEDAPSIWIARPRPGTAGGRFDWVEVWALRHPDGGCLEIWLDETRVGRISTRLGGARTPLPGSAAPTTPAAARTPIRADHRRPGVGPRDAAARRPALRRTHRWPVPPAVPGGEAAGVFEVYRLQVPRRARRVTLRVVGQGTTRLFGWRVGRRGPGVVLHNVGVVGAQAASLLPHDPRLALHQMQQIQPHLLILHTGTNEAYNDRFTESRAARTLRRLLRTLRQGQPRPDCIVVGAPDFGDRRYRRARRLRRRAARLRVLQRRVATREGCAYWDQFAAMGGRGAMRRFRRARPRLAARDRVHLTARGYRLLGTLLADALLDGFERYRRAHPALRLPAPPPPARPDPRDLPRAQWPRGAGSVPLYDPTGRALRHTYARLAVLARGARNARLSVLVLGDSHAAAEHLYGVVRRRLQRRFGDAGHGLLAAGLPWAGYGRVGLRVGARGPWRYDYILSRRRPGDPERSLRGLTGVTTWIRLPLPPPETSDAPPDAARRRAPLDGRAPTR